MITLIYGGSSSGKSAFAEDYVCGLDCRNKYYMATMSASDEESLERIKRHRNNRDGKGFETLEYPRDIGGAVSEIAVGSIKQAGENVLLLECMSNLVANEMFKDGQIIPSDSCISKILDDLKKLNKFIGNIVIVTNNVFEDSALYDDMTRDYLRALGKINQRITTVADEVYEVVVGIPIQLKVKKE